MQRGALISSNQQYRYLLTRRWGTGPSILWVMLNPSTADGKEDDPTIRRVIGFSQYYGFGAAYIVNLFALRSPDPTLLMTHPDPIGPKNDRYIKKAAKTIGFIMVAWGGKRFPKRMQDVLSGPLGDRPLHCLGTTRFGHPLHPLYLDKMTPIQMWSKEELK